MQKVCNAVYLDRVFRKESRAGFANCPSWEAVFVCVLIVGEQGLILEVETVFTREVFDLPLKGGNGKFAD
jgi:hypothetical protein